MKEKRSEVKVGVKNENTKERHEALIDENCLINIFVFVKFLKV